MPLDTRQPRCLPTGMYPRMFCKDLASAGSSALPGLHVMKLEKEYEAGQNPCCLYPPFQEKQSTHVYGFSGFAPTLPAAFRSSQKRLLVFDQTGNQTQLLHCCPFSPQLPFTAAVKPVRPTNLSDMGKRFKANHFVPGKVLLHEVFDENHVNGEETEMHEDTEEINALLDSDEHDDYGDSDDEVMSTGHSPLPIKEIYNEKEVVGFDYPHKRQKILDGWYNKSSLVDTASSVRLDESSQKIENILASSYALTGEHKTGSYLSNKQSRKDKIHTALRILECIVPGAKGKDTMLVLDEAIDHLKLLKQSAKSLGVN